jgi:hypothetical protein
MKTINSLAVLLDFQMSGGYFSAVLGKVGADLGCLELFWLQNSFFGTFWAMLRQVGAKMATKSGRMGELSRIMGSRWTQPGPSSVGPEVLGPLLILVQINPSSTEHVTSPIHAPVLEARWQIFER